MTTTMKSLDEAEELFGEVAVGKAVGPTHHDPSGSSCLAPWFCFQFLPICQPSSAPPADTLVQNSHMLALTVAWRMSALTTRESGEWGTKWCACILEASDQYQVFDHTHTTHPDYLLRHSLLLNLAPEPID